jgi:hypothetical protein
MVLLNVIVVGWYSAVTAEYRCHFLGNNADICQYYPYFVGIDRIEMVWPLFNISIAISRTAFKRSTKLTVMNELLNWILAPDSKQVKTLRKSIRIKSIKILSLGK